MSLYMSQDDPTAGGGCTPDVSQRQTGNNPTVGQEYHRRLNPGLH